MAERVLITGAGGFIGGRIAEVLHCSEKVSVRAAVRRWSSAARIGRFPMEIVLADVTDLDSCRDAMRGVSAVVHCAVGNGATNRAGMKGVLEAAYQEGVRRVVHLSTVAVFGDRIGDIDETVAPERTGNDYGDSKIDTEEVCWEYAGRGLPVVALRPTCVYGPFSENWTVEFASRMLAGRWMLPRAYCEGTANLVYVDDVVAAVVCALQSDTGMNEAYNINGPELNLTWNQYFDALNGALGFPPLNPEGTATARLATAAMQPVRKGAKFLLRRFEKPILNLYKRNALAKTVMKKAEALIRQTPTPMEYDLYSRKVAFHTTKATRNLGYRPTIDLAQGIELSAAWLRHHRYIPLNGA